MTDCSSSRGFPAVTLVLHVNALADAFAVICIPSLYNIPGVVYLTYHVLLITLMYVAKPEGGEDR